MIATTVQAAPIALTWISGAEAMRRHPGLSRMRLYGLATRHAVRTRVIPGSAVEYCAEDLMGLAAAGDRKLQPMEVGNDDHLQG
jgi:hypothetical protein